MKKFFLLVSFIAIAFQLDCDCAVKFKECPPCTESPNQEQYTYLMEMLKCGCQKQNCPSCNDKNKTENGAQNGNDKLNSDQMAKQAQEQVRLYKLANQFALESQEHKERAQEAQKLMQEALQKSDIAKQKMNIYLQQAKEIAHKLFQMQSEGELIDKNLNSNFLS